MDFAFLVVGRAGTFPYLPLVLTGRSRNATLTLMPQIPESEWRDFQQKHWPEFVADHVELFPDPKKGPWLVRVSFEEIDGRAECVGVEMWGREIPGEKKTGKMPKTATPVTASALRSLQVASVVERGRKAWLSTSKAIVEYGHDWSEHNRKAAARNVELFESRRGAPAVYDESHFAKVASVYQQAWARHEQPTKAVQEHFNVSKSTAAKWVARARNEFGLLPPTGRGQVAANPPPKKTTKRRVR